MIKLILSDIDGTLIPYGETEISDEIKSEFLRLTQKGIAVCPASGRQYRSLKEIFRPIENSLYYLCENGALVMGPGEKGEMLGKTEMPREFCRELCELLSADERLDICISGENTSYIIPKSEKFTALIKTFIGDTAKVVSSVDDVKEGIIKISAHDWAENSYYPAFCEKNSALWEGRCDCAYAGGGWLDFTVANKGTGTEMLCRALGIGLDEVMAFGDNWNDVTMLEKCGHSYLMESAAPELKEKFPMHCRKVADILKTL